MEEESNYTIPLYIWTQVGVNLSEQIRTDRYRRLQTVYQQYDYYDFMFLINSFYFSCRRLKTIKSDESYIPCTLAYLRISIIILFNEQLKVNYYF
jgi:hypothetical protein